jgi:hypothetical protein
MISPNRQKTIDRRKINIKKQIAKASGTDNQDLSISTTIKKPTAIGYRQKDARNNKLNRLKR